MTRHVACALLVLAAAPGLAGQADSSPARSDSLRTELLRQRIEARFDSIVRGDLGLSDDQATRLRATHERYGGQRREIMGKQRALREALGGQMRPGEAADADSVRKLNDAMLRNRERLSTLEFEEQRDMAQYLTPVQLARYREMRMRFFERVQDIQRRRAGAGVPRGGGAAPRPGGGQQRPRQRPPAGRPR